jgi:hypothetical protein
MDERARVMVSAIAGACVGAAVGYLFFTNRGKALWDRLEPSMDDLRREFGRFQRTLEKMGEVASEGLNVVTEFNLGRSESRRSGPLSH